MNITLIGMPGCGKSYIGKRLAKHLDFKLIELDSIMEHQYNLPLQQILDSLGEKHFLERQAQDSILNTINRDNLVISPGGSIVYTIPAMEHLQRISNIIYLEVPLEIIEQRIKNAPRGIVGLKNKSLEELYKERILLYEKYSSLRINGNQNADKVIEEIIARISHTHDIHTTKN